MNKEKVFAHITAAITSIIFMVLALFIFCPAINIKNTGFWLLIIATAFIYVFIEKIMQGGKNTFWALVKEMNAKNNDFDLFENRKRKKEKEKNFFSNHYIYPMLLVLIFIIASVISTAMFNAKSYSEILTVTESDFAVDLAESVGTDSIALMDTASAQMLGDREIGSLSNVVSQFDVSDSYTQIDYQGKPIKVAALDYAGFFKWLNNSENGTQGYVTVDPVSMSASFHESKGMRIVPSAYFFEDAERYLWMKYPTLMLSNLHFEIDEEGNPYYVASILDRAIGLFGGTTVKGCVVLDPVTGETVKYDLKDIPRWVDVVFDGDLLCTQYNWHGMYQNGFVNSLFGKKGCKQVTTYIADESEDSAPVADYGYVSKDGDIWIYTGITSLNGDSSNIGFLLANERTGESRYYAIAGADEKSAMAAAEGEVQEKNYQASFPSLINIDGHPTYIMVLKDSGGLVKLYAAVNVEQYNIVTTAATQSECIEKYKGILGIGGTEHPDESETVNITISSIKYIDIDGNTYIYLIDTEDNIYKAKAAQHENMLLLNQGDKIMLTHSNGNIIECKKAE